LQQKKHVSVNISIATSLATHVKKSPLATEKYLSCNPALQQKKLCCDLAHTKIEKINML
jgi:hypothetical protein